MASLRGFAGIASALILCPCHLALYAAIFAGSALGSAITANYSLLFAAMAVYFIVALALGVRWMTRREAPACAPCDSPGQQQETLLSTSQQRG